MGSVQRCTSVSLLLDSSDKEILVVNHGTDGTCPKTLNFGAKHGLAGFRLTPLLDLAAFQAYTRVSVIVFAANRNCPNRIGRYPKHLRFGDTSGAARLLQDRVNSGDNPIRVSEMCIAASKTLARAIRGP
eukprot:scaffold22578_cov164-Cylindrotheca_fusiformis.AAC.7